MLKLVIIGSGVVGQATGKGFIKKAGFGVVFVDTSKSKIKTLQEEGYQAISPGELRSDYADVIFLTIPTPTINGRTHLEYLAQSVSNLGERVLKNSNRRHTIVVRSTVPPGTTEQFVIPLLEKTSGKQAGKDFGVCMNPEYLREESAEEDFINPWLLVIGALDRASIATLEEVYQSFDMPIVSLSLKEAETQKYVHNLFNACKISFFNEMRMVCREAGIDSEQIFPLVASSAEGMWNPQYGIKDRGPFSGSCLPKDTLAFLGWAQDNLKMPMHLLAALIKVNEYAQEHLGKIEEIPSESKVFAESV